MKDIISKIINWIKHPRYAANVMLLHISPLFNDETYIKIKSLLLLGYWPNLKNPKTFNEKLNWLKLNNRNPLYIKLADKYEVKKYVSSIIGEEYVVPCYGVWEKFEDVDFSQLPEQFVLKTTHDSSGVTICMDKSNFDTEALTHRFKHLLHTSHYFLSREWVYKEIHPRIIADMFLDDHSNHELLDYKFWCFNGEPKFMYCTNKGKVIKENFYDMNFRPIDIQHGFERRCPEFEKPEEFDLMVELAKKLSQNIPFVRIDFFDVNHRVYFGEYTFYDWSGFGRFKNKQQDLFLGGFINLQAYE